jgi:phage shock protein A
MGIFSRLSDIVNSNVHTMLDKAEDPEKMVRLIIQEMEDTLVEVRSTAVRTLARKKEIQRHMAMLREESADWQRKAELAVSKDREDLARAALAARSRAEDRIQDLEKELAHIEQELGKLDEDTGKLKAKLADAKTRQKSIIMRQASAASRLKVQQHVNDQRMQDAMLKFEHYEGRIDTLEAQVESYDVGSVKTLQQQFEELEAGDRVEAELEALRAKVKGSKPGEADKAS